MNKVNGISTYTGGKAASGTYQTIINQIRPHDILIIPFLGHCAVARLIHHPPDHRVIGIDLDEQIINQWSSMQWGWITLLCQDGLKYLDGLPHHLPLNRKAVIYADPPYPLASRKGQRCLYRHELTDEDHHRLLALLKRIDSIGKAAGQPVDILISTYPNQLYLEQLSDWRLIEFRSTTRGGSATEWLFLNYSNDEGILHDYSYVGTNYRERERIKKKRHRWVDNLMSLPATERNAIIHDILIASRYIDKNHKPYLRNGQRTL